jgi:hypothetical protein
MVNHARYRIETSMNLSGRIFMESASGIAAASLGQIVEGYAVVFGQTDRISLRSLGKQERRDFLGFLRSARDQVEEHFGPTVMFEHGASCAGTNVSCGVNRMHVHIVPYTGRSLKTEIEKTFECGATASTIEDIVERLGCWDIDRPYFWIEEAQGVFLFSYGERRESQVVRRVIAQQVGQEEFWNWREYPTQELAERVAKDLLPDVILKPVNRQDTAFV